MEGRRGLDSNLSGPRLPRATPTDDPANGGCFGCGDKGQIMDFGLLYEGKPAGRWRLCESCYEWGNPQNPRDADPLEAA